MSILKFVIPILCVLSTKNATSVGTPSQGFGAEEKNYSSSMNISNTEDLVKPHFQTSVLPFKEKQALYKTSPSASPEDNVKLRENLRF